MRDKKLSQAEFNQLMAEIKSCSALYTVSPGNVVRGFSSNPKLFADALSASRSGKAPAGPEYDFLRNLTFVMVRRISQEDLHG